MLTGQDPWAVWQREGWHPADAVVADALADLVIEVRNQAAKAATSS